MARQFSTLCMYTLSSAPAICVFAAELEENRTGLFHKKNACQEPYSRHALFLAI